MDLCVCCQTAAVNNTVELRHEEQQSYVGGWGQQGQGLQRCAKFSVSGCQTGWTIVATKMSGDKPATTCVTLIPEQRTVL